MTIEGWEFGGVVLAHGLAVASPGPDFTLVLRQSLTRGRTAAVASAVGIGCGILVHVAYSLLGVGLVVRGLPHGMLVLKYMGVGYLTWLGIGALRARSISALSEAVNEVTTQAARGAWVQGFLTNVLNLKATFFFIALFSAISAATTKSTQVLYGAWMVFATTAWFTLVAMVFTKPVIRSAFLRMGVWLDRLTGLAFIGFALSLALADLN